MNLAFDDDGQRVGTTDFQYPDELCSEHSCDDESRLRRQTVTRLVALLVQGGDKRTVGTRVLLLAHLLRVGETKTQRDLAKKLVVTEGRASQLLKVIRHDFLAIASIFTRPAKVPRTGI